MQNDTKKLAGLLGLDPVVEKEFDFAQFLTELKEHPEAADTAAALIVRAIRDGGESEIDSATADRRTYLKMLKTRGIPSYKVFERIRGSQRLMARIMQFLEAGAENGYQLHKMIILVGGPGSGKSVIGDAFKAALEGRTVYAVAGCPVHENPINLLKLLKPEQLKAVSAELGLTDKLPEYLKVAGEPCAHCWSQAMGEGKGEPNLASVKVQLLRLSSRHKGISTWVPAAEGQGCSLNTALRQGSRGFIDMPEAFSVTESAPGRAHELDVLLEATENRRIPSGNGECSKTSGYYPLDAVLFAQSNEGAWDRFLQSLPDQDRGKWIRRAEILSVPYNTSRAEEVAAYRDFIDPMKVRPFIDPLALWIPATLAVASRMSENKDVPVELRIRLYDGEQIVIPKKVQTASPGAYNPTDRWGTLASTGSRRDSESESKTVTVEELWKQGGEQEAMFGLNMGLMRALVCQAVELAASSKHKTLSALSMLNFLRRALEKELKTPGLTDRDKKVMQRCLDEFLSDYNDKSSRVGMVEREYRRMLKQQVLSVFSPEYEKMAEQIFERYCLYAKASAKGESEVFDPRFKRKIKVDSELEFLESLERLMGKTLASEQRDFRKSLDAEFYSIVSRQAKAKEEGEDEPSEPITWRTHPELRRAIASYLDGEIARKVERCLNDNNSMELSEEERKLREESLKRFEELGYNAHSLKIALDYFRELKLWSSSEDVR